MGWLVLNHDGTDLVAHKLLGEIITIGRVRLNQVVIDNPTVSAQHAIVARLGDSDRLKIWAQQTGHRLMAFVSLTPSYADDQYDDNGYNNHDDGTNNQCVGLVRLS